MLCEDSEALPLNTWTHIAVTVDEVSRIIKLYKNGGLIDTGIASPDITTQATYINTFFLGAKTTTTSTNFKGEMDEVRLWDSALNGKDISGRMNCELRGDEGGLIFYFTFNENLRYTNSAPAGGVLTLDNFALSGSASNYTSGSPISTGVTNPVPPVTDQFIEYDLNETSTPLNATGSGLLWYTDLSTAGSTTAPTPPTFASGMTTYWVSSSNANGCASKLVPISVKVNRSTSTDCWKTVSVGTHSLAIAQDGSLWVWGANTRGQLGLDDTNNRLEPTQMGIDNDWKSVKAGTDYTLALKENGTLWAWGANNWGQLGLGDLTDRDQPVQVGVSTDWAVINTKHYTSFAIKSDHSLWSWGYNNQGLLGSGGGLGHNIPIQVGSDTDWERIATHGTASFAIKTNGTLWSSGEGNYNGLGFSVAVYTQVGTDNNWRDISNGGLSIFATKYDSSLWGLGSFSRGSLAPFSFDASGAGAGNRNAFAKARDNNWVKVETTTQTGVVLKTDGTLWAWGRNTDTAFDLTGTVRFEVIQIGTDTDWIDFSLGETTTLVALKEDGGLYSIGTNTDGVLGLGDAVNRSSFQPIDCPINLDGFFLHFEEVTDPALGSNFSLGSLAFADVDNDGDQDLYTTGFSSLVPTSVLYKNDGSGKYTPVANSGVVPTANGPVAFADVDNDGDQDLLVSGLGSTYQPGTKLFLNDGNGGFVEDATTLFPSFTGGSIAFEYIDNDNYIDVVITGSLNTTPTTKMFLNTGTGSFTEVVSTPLENVDNSSIAFADVNNDTYPDLLITGNSASSSISKLYTNDGLGNFTVLSGATFEGVSAGSVAFADVNNDSYLDLVISGFGSNGLTTKLYLNSATTTFTEATNLPFESVNDSSIAFSDVDNDGDPDLLITGSGDEPFIAKLYANDGAGNFTQVSNVPFQGVTNSSVSFTDIDNDGDQDVVIMGSNRSGAATRLYRNLSNRASWVGGENADWTNANNWGDSTLPTLSDEINITPTAVNQPVITASEVAQVGAINIDQNASLEVYGVLKVNTKLNNDGLITFKSDATSTGQLDQFNAKYSGTGAVMTERFIPAGKRAFRFISPSVTTTNSMYENWQEGGATASGFGIHITGVDGAANGFDPTGTNNPSAFTFDNTVLDQTATSPWNAVTSTNGILEAGTPYRLFIRGDRTVDLATNQATPTATVLRTQGQLLFGNYNPALSPGNGNYSFVGNPYQAAVDFNALSVGGDLNTNFMYVWDPQLGATGTYVTVDLSDGSNIVGSNANQFIQPGQAFFVRNNLTVNTAPTITFNETSKAVTFFFFLATGTYVTLTFLTVLI